ncbi:hypothetical protein ACJX0J_010578, partial [Zea mays]
FMFIMKIERNNIPQEHYFHVFDVDKLSRTSLLILEDWHYYYRCPLLYLNTQKGAGCYEFELVFGIHKKMYPGFDYLHTVALLEALFGLSYNAGMLHWLHAGSRP